jgi:hypothetical protein
MTVRMISVFQPICSYPTVDQRTNVINKLTARSTGTETGPVRLVLALEVKGNGISLAMYFVDLHLHST